jgi:copper homeostasis protein
MKEFQLDRKAFMIENCANSVQSCVEAQKGGADRVELCAGIPEGGTTPSLGEIVAARKLLHIKLHVIIRPRGGDFLYSPLELEIMEHDIQEAVRLGADGVVFGCLTKDGAIDMPANERLMKAATGISTTFHRAFDCCKNPSEALEQIISLGFKRILTSGQESAADKGIPLLKSLNEQSKGRIILMAGCGVNERNIAKIYKETDIKEYHFSAREKQRSDMSYINPHVFMGDKDADEYSIETTSADKVQRTIEALLKA